MTREKENLELEKLKLEIWSTYNHDTHKCMTQTREIIQANHTLLDKSLLYMSSGAYVLSIYLLREFAQITTPYINKIFLSTSWCLFGISIIAIILSYKTSIKYFENRLKEFLNESADTLGALVTGRAYEKHELDSKNWTACTESLNQLSFLTFALGIVCLSVFAVKTYLEI